MTRYRVFISYSHDDEAQDSKIAQIESALEANGLEPMSDKHLPWGKGFTDEIKILIEHAHVFLPVITVLSNERRWVHQEIGYALAMGVPVLPLVWGDSDPCLPEGMVQQLQAVTVQDDGADLSDKLKHDQFRHRVTEYANPAHTPYRCALLHEDRTELMADYARKLTGMGKYACVRQRGALSSFHLPTETPRHRVWRDRDGGADRGERLHKLQREERLALGEHAAAAGCRLMINPYIPFERYGQYARKCRLQSLLRFLTDQSFEDVQVVINEVDQSESLTIVGDWFAAQSAVARLGTGYLQTIFTRHAPTVTRQIKEFDDEFAEKLADLGWTPESSRARAVDEIEGIVKGL